MKKNNLLRATIMTAIVALTLSANGSTTANQVFANTDLTVTIKNPHFRVGGQSLPVSMNSDLNGVCALHGFNKAIASGMLTSQEVSNTVSLDKNANFKGFVYGPKIEMVLCHSDSNIYCTRSETETTYSKRNHKRYAWRQNTCHRPWVGTRLHGYYLSADSDVPGLCDRLGLGTYKPFSVKEKKSPESTLIELNQNVSFSGFRRDGLQIALIYCQKVEQI